MSAVAPNAMVTIIIFAIITGFSMAVADRSANYSINLSMEREQIVPDVIDVAPNDTVEVTYPSQLVVNNGNELTPAQVKNAPTNVTWPAEENSLYTLLMVDPDAPSRQMHFLREINHWLVINIKGNNVSSGTTITPYRGSRPPEGTGLHRYIFLVFKQNGQISLNQTVSDHLRENRRTFSTRKFTQEHNLGNPVAGNFYQAQFKDESTGKL